MIAACCDSVSKEPILSLGAYSLAYTDSGPPEPKIFYNTSPGPNILNDATPLTRSVLGGPSHEGSTPRASVEPSSCKGSAHTSPEGRGLWPPARGAPPRQARGFSSPGAINLAEIRYLVPGSSVGNSP